MLGGKSLSNVPECNRILQESQISYGTMNTKLSLSVAFFPSFLMLSTDKIKIFLPFMNYEV